jgi:hypothetical protein
VNVSRTQRWMGYSRVNWPWQWAVGGLFVASLVSSSPRLNQRLPMMLQDVAFVVLIFAAFGLPGLAWTAFVLSRRSDDFRQWRMEVSFFGCVALSVAFASPFVCAVSSLDWMHVGAYLCVFKLDRYPRRSLRPRFGAIWIDIRRVGAARTRHLHSVGHLVM